MSQFKQVATPWARGGKTALPARGYTAVTGPETMIVLLSIVFLQMAVPNANPTYSNALYMGQDPKGKLQEAEAILNNPSHRNVRLVYLPEAAKAALEAGENGKAQAYAVEALALAEVRKAKNKTFATPRLYLRTGEADFYCNFVLGRLAILNGDVRSAEKYLFLSGQSAAGPVLASYGPNLSLALEILNQGDEVSRQCVYTFLEQIRIFWKITPSVIDAWEADLAAGKIPDFKEQVYR